MGSRCEFRAIQLEVDFNFKLWQESAIQTHDAYQPKGILGFHDAYAYAISDKRPAKARAEVWDLDSEARVGASAEPDSEDSESESGQTLFESPQLLTTGTCKAARSPPKSLLPNGDLIH